MPMNRTWCAPDAVRRMLPSHPRTSFGIRGAYEGSIRLPGGGRALSGVLVRTMIHPVPAFAGSVNGPVYVAPAWSVITSPGLAALSAAWKSPRADTAILRPGGVTGAVSTNRRGRSGAIAGEGDAPPAKPKRTIAATRTATTDTGRGGTRSGTCHTRESHWGGGILTIEEDPQPHLEIDEEPEAIAVLANSLPVLLRKPSQHGWDEQPSLEHPRSEHELFYDWPEWPPEPPAYRDREPHLAACEDLLGQHVPERRPQDGFGPPPAELEATRHRRDPVDKPMIEERHPTFDGRRHAHLILLHQQLDEVRLQIRVTHPLECSAGSLRVAPQLLGVGIAGVEEP